MTDAVTAGLCLNVASTAMTFRRLMPGWSVPYVPCQVSELSSGAIFLPFTQIEVPMVFVPEVVMVFVPTTEGTGLRLGDGGAAGSPGAALAKKAISSAVNARL